MNFYEQQRRFITWLNRLPPDLDKRRRRLDDGARREWRQFAVHRRRRRRRRRRPVDLSLEVGPHNWKELAVSNVLQHEVDHVISFEVAYQPETFQIVKFL